MDSDTLDIPEKISIYADKNYTYVENKKLKSVNLLSKKVFMEYYFQKNSFHIETEKILEIMMQDVICESNPALKGILFEKYIIQHLSNYKQQI